MMRRIRAMCATVLLVALGAVGVFSAAPAQARSNIHVCRVQTADFGQWDCVTRSSAQLAHTALQDYYSWVVSQGYVAQLVIYRDIDYVGDQTLLYSGGPCTSGTLHSFQLDEVYGSYVFGYWDNQISSISNATGWTHGSGCTVRLYQGYTQAGDYGSLSPGDASFSNLGDFGWNDSISSMTLVGS